MSLCGHCGFVIIVLLFSKTFVQVSEGSETSDNNVSLQLNGTSDIIIVRWWLPPDFAGNITRFELTWYGEHNRDAVSQQNHTATDSLTILAGLTPGETYKVCVAVVTDARRNVTCNSTTLYPEPPLNPVLLDKTDTSLHLKWQQPRRGYVDKYRVQYCAQAGKCAEMLTDSPKILFSPLTPGTFYNVSVWSQSNAVDSLLSAVETFATLLSTPTGVSVCTHAECTNTSLWVHWTPDSASQTTYHVTCQPSSSGVSAVSGSVDPSLGQYNCEGLLSGAHYVVVVTNLKEGFPNASSSATAMTIPNLPAQLKVSHQDVTSVTLSWGEVTGGCSEVHVQFKGQSGQGDASAGCSQGKLTIALLHSNDMYKLTLWVTSVWQTTVVKSHKEELVAYTASAAVSKVWPEVNSSHAVSVTWQFPQENVHRPLDRYVLQLSTSGAEGEEDCVHVVVVSNANPIETPPPMSWTPERPLCQPIRNASFTGYSNVSAVMTGLEPCTSYKVKVISFSRNAPETDSAEYPATTYAGQIRIDTVSSTSRSVSISWLPPANPKICAVSAYELRCHFHRCASTPDKIDIEVPRYQYEATVPKLEPYMNVSCVIVARSPSGHEYSESESRIVQTKETAPGRLRSLEVTSTEHDEISISWQTPAECDWNGVIVYYLLSFTYADRASPSVIEGEGNVTLPAGVTHANLSQKFHIWPYKTYTLNLHAFTTELGPPLTVTINTSESVPGVVDADTFHFDINQTNIAVMWQPPATPNGRIVGYTLSHENTRTGSVHLKVVNRTTAQLTSLQPYSTYKIMVKAGTAVGDGPFSRPIKVATSIGVPRKPVLLEAKAVGPSEIHLKWQAPDLVTGPTNYTVYAVDAATKIAHTNHTYGFKETSAQITGLDAYWLYKVYVVARTDAGAQKSDTKEVLTKQSAPRAVANFAAVHESGICDMTALHVSWDTLTDPNRRGKIQNYTLQVSAESSNVLLRSFLEEEGSPVQNVIIPVPAQKTIKLKIWASSEVAKGAVVERSVQSGSCPPALPSTERDGFPGPTNLIGEVADEEHSVLMPKSQFVVRISDSFYGNEGNGRLTKRGVIVMDSETSDLQTIGKAQRFASDASFLAKFNSKWNDIRNMAVMKPYRVELDLDMSHNERRKRSLPPPEPHEDKVVVVIGAERECAGLPANAYCNGYVNPGRAYRVQAYACTDGGCAVTAVSIEFHTASSGSSLIAIAILVPIFIILIIAIALVVFLMRKKQLGPFKVKATRTKSSNGSVGTLNPSFIPLDDQIKRPEPVSIKVFPEHVKMLHKDSDLVFSEEYKLLKSISVAEPTIASELPENRIKNRYTDILAFDHSRVKLLPLEDVEGSDYINANYVPGYNSKREFIAAQGPLQSTKDDFWRMIWEQNVPIIVMLTRLFERGKEKCAQYWPNDNDPVFYGDVQVQVRSESVLDNHTIRIIDIRIGEVSRMIKMFHFTAWNDFGCPTTTDVMLHFVRVVRSHVRPDFKGPTLVHCSAGVGRTGTFICVDHLLQHIEHFDSIDIFGMVLEMRRYRCKMVQTEDQYIYIHDCLRDALKMEEEEELKNEQEDTSKHIYANVDAVGVI